MHKQDYYCTFNPFRNKFLTTLLTVLFTVLSPRAGAQPYIPFMPPVYNYHTHHYKAGNQNWAAAEGKDGILYFGNNNGLLSFEGINWQLHILPNNVPVKSIFIEQEEDTERIYTGAFEEFGYFERDEMKRMVYHSLKSLVTEYEFHNDEIWKICPLNGKIYFQSFSALFVYDGKRVEVIKPYPAVLYLFPFKEKVFAQLIDNDFCRFDGTSFHRLLSREQLNNDHVVAVLPIDNELLLVTSRHGLFRFSETKHSLVPWKIPVEKMLHEAIINRAICADDSLYLFGTLNSGLLAIDKTGKERWHINRSNGLNNNTVLALYYTSDHSVWAALDNGISNIRIHSPLSFFEPVDMQIGLVEDMLIFRNELFLATNQGIYRYSETDNNFLPVPQFDIQSWFVKTFANRIFVGHNLGVSLLEKNRNLPIPETDTGGTDMKQVTLYGKNVLLQSSYTTLNVYQQAPSGDWTFSHRVKGFSDLIKNIETDHAGNIWAGHMYKGIYRIKLDSELLEAVETEYYPSLDSTEHATFHPIKVMKLSGRVVFSDGNRFFTYDDMLHQIIPFDRLNEDLPGVADTYRIVPVHNDRFWFVRNKEYTLVERSENRYDIIDRVPYTILNNPPNEGRANVYVVDEKKSFLCLNGGIAAYTASPLPSKEKRRLQIISVTYSNRKNDQSFHLDPTQKGIIAFRNNRIGFRFLSPDYSKKPFRIECFLQGYDNRWVHTRENLSMIYDNLPAGDYTLRACLIDDSDEEIDTATFSFRIKNPWYKTGVAYLSYILLFLMISGWIIKNHVRKIIRKKNELFEKQENRRIAQLTQQEKEIAALKNEKLQAELTYKGKELANASLMLINHSEFLKKLQTTIQSHILNRKINRAEGQTLLSMIDKNLSKEDEWSVFQENFDLIHKNFFQKLKARYPSLTPSDLKLCTLLRLNYSSKEIAGKFHLTIRGVESARYRLRKKLNLSETDNLVDFLISFQ